MPIATRRGVIIGSGAGPGIVTPGGFRLGTGGVSPFAFTFKGLPFTFGGQSFTYGAP